MNTTATNRKIRVLLSALRNEKLIPRPEFQRRLVWSNKHKLSFIETILKGFPFPEIYIAAGEVDADTAEGTEMLVDGQQRVTTLNQYFTGSAELKIVEELPSYESLTPEEKMKFLEYEVVIRDLGRQTIGQIKEVFKRINSTSYSLNAMEIHNARYDGAFKKFAETIAQDKFFEDHGVFSPGDVRRMHDARFALMFIISIMSTYFNRDEELEAYLQRYNDDFNDQEQLSEEIHAVFEFIQKCSFTDGSRAWKKADLLTLLVEVHRALYKAKEKIKASRVSSAIKQFYKRVGKMSDLSDSRGTRDAIAYEYYQAALQATNDRSSRITRGKIIKKIINEVPS